MNLVHQQNNKGKVIMTRETFHQSGIQPGQMFFLRTEGSGDVGDTVRLVRVEGGGIVFYLSTTFPNIFLSWRHIVEVK